MIVVGAFLAWLVLAIGQAAGLDHVWLFSFAHELGVAVVIVAAAWACGVRLVQWLTPEADVSAWRDPLAVLAGAMLLALAVFGLGLAGLLGRASLIALLGLALAVGPWRAGYARFRLARTANAALADRWLRAERALLALAFLFGLAYASLPPTFYDTIVYHLALPNLYLASGAIVPLVDFSIAGFPQNAELIATMGLAQGGEKAAQMTGYLLAWIIVLAVRAWLRERSGVLAASLGTLFVALGWPFFFQACFLKNDWLGAGYLFAAFALLADPKAPVPMRRAGFAGALAGFAAGVKLTNVIPAALLGLVALGAWKQPRRAAFVVFGAFALLAASPWPLRNAVVYGNPVHPALSSLSAKGALDDAGAARMRDETGQSLDRSLGAAAMRVLTLGIDREGRGSGGEASPLLLVSLIAGLVATRDVALRRGLALALATLVLGLGFVSAYPRVFAVAFVLAALAPAALLTRVSTLRARVALAALFTVAALAGWAESIVRAERVASGARLVFTATLAPDEWLVLHHNHVPLARAIDRNLPRDARLLVLGSTRTTYIPRACAWTYVWDRSWVEGARASGQSAPALVASLRDVGFTHVFINEPELRDLDARYGLYDLDIEEGRAWWRALLAALRPVARENGCVLYEL